MPEKHLFVNASHYQDKPDPNMRHKIASHAAKYGPNGSLAFKTSPEKPSASTAQVPSTGSSRHAVAKPKGSPGAPMQRSASISSATSDVRLRQDYEAMLSKFDNFCACTDANTKGPKMKGTTKHSDDCSLLDDYLELCSQQELPFRVFPNAQRHCLWPTGALNDNGLVLQCHLVATQAAIDGLDVKFAGKPSKQTLTLQQKALSAMQNMISGRPNVIDDSLVLTSAILMSVAVGLPSASLVRFNAKKHRHTLTIRMRTERTNLVCRRWWNRQVDVFSRRLAILPICRFHSSRRE